MAQFRKKKVTSDQPLGEQLRAVRRTAKLSLEQVAVGTKIHRKYLEALEKGDYAAFPAEVYLRGFLENYAAFLGFPVDEVLLQYKRERGITPAIEEKRVLDLPQRRYAAQSRLTITPKTLGFGFGLLSLVVAVGYLLSQVFSFASPPKLEVFSPAANATVGSDTISVEGRTDRGAELSINNQPVPTDPEGGFKEQVRVQPGANTLRVAAKNKSGRERAVSRQVLAQLPGVASPTPAAVPNSQLLTIKIGPNAAYVTVTVDGKQAFTGLLTAGTEQSFIVTSRALLTTSNAGSTRAIIGGADQGPVGREGQYRRGIEYLLTPPSPPPSPGPQ